MWTPEGHLLDFEGGAVWIADPFLGLWLAEGRRGIATG